MILNNRIFRILREIKEDIAQVICLLKKLVRNHVPAPTALYELRFSVPSIHQMFFQGVTLMNLTTEQKVSVTVTGAKTALGNPAQIFGAATFTSDTPSVATVSPNADGLSAEVFAVGVGAAQINVSFEGDPTPGVDTVHLSGAVNVVAAEAAVGELTFGTPELNTPPAPAPVLGAG
jgi:hypothetical protein